MAATVKESPPFQRWNAAFLDHPGVFESKPLASFYYISPPDPAWPPAEQRAYIPPTADLLFTSGFLLFSQALLERWRPNWLLRARIAIWALSILLCAAALLFDHLPFELASSDFGCFLLIGLPLIAGRSRLDNWSDRTLFGAATLVALDNLIRGSTMPLTLSGGNFLNSDYAFLMQALACVFGLFLALARAIRREEIRA